MAPIKVERAHEWVEKRVEAIPQTGSKAPIGNTWKKEKKKPRKRSFHDVVREQTTIKAAGDKGMLSRPIGNNETHEQNWAYAMCEFYLQKR
jgi:hypothetical protein